MTNLSCSKICKRQGTSVRDFCRYIFKLLTRFTCSMCASSIFKKKLIFFRRLFRNWNFVSKSNFISLFWTRLLCLYERKVFRHRWLETPVYALNWFLFVQEQSHEYNIRSHWPSLGWPVCYISLISLLGVFCLF